MKIKRYYLYLTPEEKAEIIYSLVHKRNTLIEKGKYTDAVDDVLSKIWKSRRKKITIRYLD